MIRLGIVVILNKSLLGQAKKAIGDVIHLPLAHLNIGPAHRFIHYSHAAQTVSLHDGSGIGRGIAGILQFNFLLNGFSHNINSGNHDK